MVALDLPPPKPPAELSDIALYTGLQAGFPPRADYWAELRKRYGDRVRAIVDSYRWADRYFGTGRSRDSFSGDTWRDDANEQVWLELAGVAEKKDPIDELDFAKSTDPEEIDDFAKWLSTTASNVTKDQITEQRRVPRLKQRQVTLDAAWKLYYWSGLGKSKAIGYFDKAYTKKKIKPHFLIREAFNEFLAYGNTHYIERAIGIAYQGRYYPKRHRFGNSGEGNWLRGGGEHVNTELDNYLSFELPGFLDVDEVERARAILSEVDRETLRLYFAEGLTDAQAAERCQCTESGFNSRRRRALERLRRIVFSERTSARTLSLSAADSGLIDRARLWRETTEGQAAWQNHRIGKWAEAWPLTLHVPAVIDDVQACNCARCQMQLTGLTQLPAIPQNLLARALIEIGPLVAGCVYDADRVNERPYCARCLGIVRDGARIDQPHGIPTPKMAMRRIASADALAD